jgi:hypothetical protein
MNPTATYYVIGKLADNPRGKRLLKSLSATPVVDPPEGTGMCLGSGQDYQTRTPADQRQWLAWAARPGCSLLLLPPFQTAVRHEPNGWEMASLEKSDGLDTTAHLVLRLTQPELNVYVARGFARTLNSSLDGPNTPQLCGLFRKYPDSGIFAVTSVPIWSLALADHIHALQEWLATWLTLAGRAPDASHPVQPVVFEPAQSHYSVMLYLASGQFPSRAAALAALAWNDTFELSGEDVPTLLDDLEAAGLIATGALTEKGRHTLLTSSYRRYAEVYLTPSFKL